MARIYLPHLITHPKINGQEGPWPNRYPRINLSRTQPIQWLSTPHHPGHSRAVAHACPRRRHDRCADNRRFQSKIGQTLRSTRIREYGGARECVFTKGYADEDTGRDAVVEAISGDQFPEHRLMFSRSECVYPSTVTRQCSRYST